MSSPDDEWTAEDILMLSPDDVVEEIAELQARDEAWKKVVRFLTLGYGHLSEEELQESTETHLAKARAGDYDKDKDP